MRIGIIACDIWKREIDAVVGDDPSIVHKEYLEFALHVDSAKLKATVIEKVNSLEGKVDAVFLGYATCQSLKGRQGGAEGADGDAGRRRLYRCLAEPHEICRGEAQGHRHLVQHLWLGGNGVERGDQGAPSRFRHRAGL